MIQLTIDLPSVLPSRELLGSRDAVRPLENSTITIDIIRVTEDD